MLPCVFGLCPKMGKEVKHLCKVSKCQVMEALLMPQEKTRAPRRTIIMASLPAC